jgi:chromosome segregation ATPase
VKRQLAEADALHGELDRDRQLLATELEGARGELERMRQTEAAVRAELEAERQAWEAAAQEAAAQAAGLRTRIAALERETTELLAAGGRNHAELAASQEAVERLSREVEAGQVLADGLRAEAEQQAADLHALRGSAEAQLAGVKRQLAEADALHGELDRDRQLLATELEGARGELERMRQTEAAYCSTGFDALADASAVRKAHSDIILALIQRITYLTAHRACTKSCDEHEHPSALIVLLENYVGECVRKLLSLEDEVRVLRLQRLILRAGYIGQRCQET